jgi:hypothetical protein
MNYNTWLYCACGWQTEFPNQAVKNECPDCRTTLRFVGGSTAEMNDLKERVKNGQTLAEIMKPIRVAKGDK